MSLVVNINKDCKCMSLHAAGFTLVGDTFTMEETCTKYNIYKYLLAKNYTVFRLRK